MMKGSPDNAPSPLQLLAGANSPRQPRQWFDMGPESILLSIIPGPCGHEVEIDSEEPRGEEDTMGLIASGGVAA